MHELQNRSLSIEREKYLWQLLDRTRGEYAFGDLAGILGWLDKQGESVNLPDIAHFARLFGRHLESILPPTWITAFLGRLLRSRSVTSFLDPWSRDGLAAAELAAELRPERADVVSPMTSSIEIYRHAHVTDVGLHIGRYGDVKEKLKPSYDAVVFFPPWGQPRVRKEYRTENGIKVIRDDPSYLLILDAAESMADTGLMVVLVPPSFWFRSTRDSVRQNLATFGYQITALLHLPPGTFSIAGIPTELAIIERTSQPGLFVGAVPEDPTAQNNLIKRLNTRPTTGNLSQGLVVDPSEFLSFGALQAEETQRKLAREKGLQAVPFLVAISDIAMARQNRDGIMRFDENPNAVYLPEMARTKATLSQAELPENLRSYFQLIVNPQVVHPAYLAHWLNSPSGYIFRDGARSGTTIPRIHRDILMRMSLYLPPIPDQERTVQALEKIGMFRSDLDEIESSIWDRPLATRQVLEKIGRFNHEERFLDWVESLPFPLASILRSYETIDQTDKDKYERLLHFFEALAAFLATIHLSACRPHSLIWPVVREQLRRQLLQENLSFVKPTFGLWRAVLMVLSPTVRKYLNGTSDEKAVCLSIYRTSDADVMQMLCSKLALSLLEKANTYRNRWSGHGGSPSPTEARNRLDQIRVLLDDFRSGTGMLFQRYQILKMDRPDIREGGNYEYPARRVMGSNPQFEQATIQLNEPMETGSLCFHSPGYPQALKLIQFVQIEDAPQPACYFYNRVTSNSTHLVSYHFAVHSDRESPNIPRLIRELLIEFQP